ncbi:MAG TPA: S8 family peptidase [Xenococcaceae cyanobacterium]
MPEYQRNLPHIHLLNNGKPEVYTYPGGGGGGSSFPSRNRLKHANFLEQAYEKVLEEFELNLLKNKELTTEEQGIYVEFQVSKDEKKALEKLENSPKKIELVAVRESEDRYVKFDNVPMKFWLLLLKVDCLAAIIFIPKSDALSATVFIPEKAKDFFSDRIKSYRDEDTKKGKPKNEALVACLENIQLSTVHTIFTDDIDLFPEENKTVWWEVWLRRDRKDDFISIAEKLEIRTQEHTITFPEREVILALCNAIQLSQVIRNTAAIAELRLAKDNPSVFFEMTALEEKAWVDEMAERIEILPSSNQLAVCLLDYGVNRIHSLIKPALQSSDLLTYDPTWNPTDTHGHGTNMAAIVLYQDLFTPLTTSQKIQLTHCLESVKIMPDRGDNNPKLYGDITKQAIARAEINAPNRKRIICMPVTSEIDTNQGIPSSWSGAIDQQCFGEEDFKRLIVLPVGNIRQDIISTDYPARNDLSQAENPSQAWNALVVGAYTDKVNITNQKFSHYQALAPAGDLSPRSRTSTLWEKQWPIRPDVVFEGGNLATNGTPHGWDVDDLRLLTTHYRPNVRQFDTFGDTSSATALGAYMSARLCAKYPNYWLETIRALIVHSAEWTPAMLNHLGNTDSKRRRASQQQKLSLLLRRYGYGVPNLDKALQSAENNLVVILEDQLQPFVKSTGSNIKTKEMNLHQLPWPRQELEKLREVEVEMRVTLSYFIEPNPGQRGWLKKHSYASHGLRFDVKRSQESLKQFKKGVSRSAREEGEKFKRTPDSGWFLGQDMMTSGSIHSDTWRGTMAELASRDTICVYPVSGWWRYNTRQEKYNEIVRYALVISIRVLKDVEINLHTLISNQVKQTVLIDA